MWIYFNLVHLRRYTDSGLERICILLCIIYLQWKDTYIKIKYSGAAISSDWLKESHWKLFLRRNQLLTKPVPANIWHSRLDVNLIFFLIWNFLLLQNHFIVHCAYCEEALGKWKQFSFCIYRVFHEISTDSTIIMCNISKLYPSL